MDRRFGSSWLEEPTARPGLLIDDFDDTYVVDRNGVRTLLPAGGGGAGPPGATGPAGPTGATGATGAAGSAGTPGSVWRDGTGAPASSLGVDGDYYLQGNGNVYLKSAGSYSIVENIKGVTGTAGAAGATGATGATGAAGSNGAAGVDGATWRDGTGVPSNALGVNGDFYLDDATGNVYKKAAGTYGVVANIKGATGATGAAGAGGATGATGAAGATGPPGSAPSVIRCQAIRSSTFQSIPDATLTAMIWNNADTYDTDNMHDPSVNPSRMVAKTAGVYVMSSVVVWAAVTAGIRGIGFRVNGSGMEEWVAVTSVGSPIAHVSQGRVQVPLALNDYVEVIVYQNSGAAINAGSNDTLASVMSKFSAARMGDL